MGIAAFHDVRREDLPSRAAECCRREHILELTCWQRLRHRVVTSAGIFALGNVACVIFGRFGWQAGQTG
jgi:hypothetical protein